jgi:hypothetical protein
MTHGEVYILGNGRNNGNWDRKHALGVWSVLMDSSQSVVSEFDGFTQKTLRANVMEVLTLRATKRVLLFLGPFNDSSADCVSVTGASTVRVPIFARANWELSQESQDIPY